MLKYNKIAILHPQSSIKGGAIQVMLQLGISINKSLEKDNQVDFYVFEKNGVECFPELQSKINIIDLSGGKSFYKNKLFRLFLFFKLFFKLKNYDLIISGNSPMHFIMLLAKVFFKIKRVSWFLHNYPLYYLNDKSIFIYLKRYIEKILIKNNIDDILVPSNFLKNKVKNIYLIDALVIPPVLNSVFLKNLNNNISLKNYLVKKEIIIFFYGRIEKDKNLELLLNLINKLNLTLFKTKLVIGGDGSHKEFLEKVNYCDNVIFLGKLNQEDIIDNLKKSDFFIMSSTNESLALTIPESASIGLPIFALNKEYIRSNYYNSSLIVFNDINDLFNKLIMSINNPVIPYSKANNAIIDMSIYFKEENFNNIINKYINK